MIAGTDPIPLTFNWKPSFEVFYLDMGDQSPMSSLQFDKTLAEGELSPSPDPLLLLPYAFGGSYTITGDNTCLKCLLI